MNTGAVNRAQRKVAFVKAKMRRGDGWVDVSIANVSSTGLMIKTQAPPAVGSVVEIRHRGWGVTGEVVWATHSRAGIRAFDTIDVAELTGGSGLGDTLKSDMTPPPRWTPWHWVRPR